MKVYPLIDGKFFVNKNKGFYNLEEAAGLNGLKIAVRPFLIQTDEDLLLLDTGLGWIGNNQMMILDHIQKAGFMRDQVTKILLSHLHKDHIGGLVNKKMSGWELNFPDVPVYIQKREYGYALTQATSSSFDLVLLQFIIDHANIHWLDEDEGRICPSVRFEVSGGHTPFHQVFWIEEEGEIAFYGGDNLPTAAYLKMDIAYKTDYDGRKAMIERQQWRKRAQLEGWKILLYHDLDEGIISLDRSDR